VFPFLFKTKDKFGQKRRVVAWPGSGGKAKFIKLKRIEQVFSVWLRFSIPKEKVLIDNYKVILKNYINFAAFPFLSITTAMI